MTPFYFDGCAAWYHAPPASPASPASHATRVAVLCDPLGHESLWAHKGTAVLAERLAGSGVPALRFEYPDTGDSADLPEAVARVPAWEDSIVAACRVARELSGADEVLLIGVRAGAMLGARLAAAGRLPGVTAVAMLAPATRGKMFLRELRLLDQTWRGLAGPAVAAAVLDDDALHALGYRFGAQTLSSLSEIDLLKAPALPARQLFVAGAPIQVGTLVDAYRALGAAVEAQPFAEQSSWLQEPVHSEVPDELFDTLLRWIDALPAAEKRTHAMHDAVERQDRLESAEWVETPVRFGAGLIGVLCEPRAPAPALPALLITNAGGTHKVGAGRGGVTMAREFAGLGGASLRIDVRGIGDSAISLPRVSTEPVDPDGYLDAIQAVDWLAARGMRRVVAFGVSYGASLSLHAAHGHPNVVGAITVNLQRLRMREDFVRPRWIIHGRAAPVLEEGGGADIDAGTVLPIPSPDESRAVAAMMAALAARGVALHMLFGPGDPGPFELSRYFGVDLAGLAGLPSLRVGLVGALDHGMLNPPGRRQVMDFCMDVLTGRERDHPIDWMVPGHVAIGGRVRGDEVDSMPVATARNHPSHAR